MEQEKYKQDASLLDCVVNFYNARDKLLSRRVLCLPGGSTIAFPGKAHAAVLKANLTIAS